MTANARQAESPPDQTAERLLEAGLQRHRAGAPAEAEALFRQALAVDARNATALYLLSLIRFEAGAAAEALAFAERLTAVRPDHADAHLTLANIRHWRDDRAGAIAAYRRGLELDPAHLPALVGLSRALEESGDAEAARAAAERATLLAPQDTAAWMALAVARRSLGEVREGAAAFAEAARLAPDLTAAHVGLSLAHCDTGEAEAARLSAERAVQLDPNLCDAWLALGAALRGVHRSDDARAAFERALAIDPRRTQAHLNLGLAFIELERPDDARRHLLAVLDLDPTSAKAHANLSSLYYRAGRKQLAKAHAHRALALEPNLMSAHQNLAALLAEEQRPDEARVHRDRAYTERNLIVTTAAQPLARILILSTTESGNIPERHLIPPSLYTRLLWFIEYAGDGQMGDLPAYDVAFNAIGDEDLAGPTAANMRRFAEACPTRLLNPPGKIVRTRRDRVDELFGTIPGLKIPRTVRLDASQMTAGARAAAVAAGVGETFLVRPIGSHGGKGMFLVGGDAPDEALTPAGAYYLTAFEDFRSADGFYRKYRMIFVDRAPLPYHLAISPNWMVHYESAGMETSSERLAEEMIFLQDPARALGQPALDAVTAIGQAMDLDYAGIDFSLLPDGRVLLFEANATMLVHPEATDGPLAHKNPAIETIFTAFRAMLARA